MRSQRVAWKIQGIAGILVDTSCAHQEDDSVRVFVRVIRRDGNICAASSLSNPLKKSPTGNGSSAGLQRHVAFWPEFDDPVVLEVREGERFQLQVCLNLPGKGNFPIGAGSWQRSANNDVSDVLVGCALAADKRRSIAYCIDSKGGAMLRVMAISEALKGESMNELHEDLNTESIPFFALKRQQLLPYSSLDDDHPVNVSIERVLSARFEPEATCAVPIKQEVEMRSHDSTAKSRFGRFFQRSDNISSEKKMNNRNKAVASPRVPAKQDGVRKDGQQPKGTTNSRRIPFWTSPKPDPAKAKPSRSQAKESVRQGSPVCSPIVRSGPVDCDDFIDSPVVGYEGMNWVDNADNELPIHDMNAIAKDLFPPERSIRGSSEERPLSGVLPEEKTPRPLVLHPGKIIPRQFSEDSESFSDVFERPLTKMQLRSISPRTTTPSPILERFGSSKMVSSYRNQSPTGVWESMSSRTPSPVEISTLHATEATIINPRHSMQHLPSQPSPRTESQHGAIPTHSLSDAHQEMYRFQRRQAETFPESLDCRPVSSSYNTATVQRRPNSRVGQQDTMHTYSRDTQLWRSEQVKPENKRYNETCLRMSQPSAVDGIFACGTHTDDGGRIHHFDKESLNAKYPEGRERASTPVNETLSTADSDSSEAGGFEPPPDFLFCQGDGSYFCKPDEDAVLRRRRLWKEKMRYVAERHPSTVGEEQNDVDYPSYGNFASAPLKNTRLQRGDGYERSTSQKMQMASEAFRSTRPHDIRSSKDEDKKPESPVPPALESWSPKGLLEENAKTLGQSIVALVEPFAACALVRPPDRPTVPTKVPSTIEGEETTSVGELTATSYERQIDRMRRRQSTSHIQETIRSSQQSALKFFGLNEDALDIRSSRDRTCSVSTKKEDYFSDYKGLQ